jgi:tRNA(Ile)-lysidine synthase
MRIDPAVAATRRAVRDCLADLDAGDRVLVAVSGGADSLALSAAVAHEAPRLGLQPGAVTVDHGLQDGSAQQAKAAVVTCEGFGLAPVIVEKVTVGTWGGPEAAARSARYQALDAVASELEVSAILLGHTLDDQAETVLLGLGRGSGARSLAGMPARRGLLRRPFLGVRRETTLAACQALGLAPWSDPHNANPGFARVRVRERALPALVAALGPGVAEALARSAALLRADADALDGWAQEVVVAHDRDGWLVETLATFPAAVRTRALRSAAIKAGVPAGSLTADQVAEVDRLVTDWHGQGAVSLPGALVAERVCGRLSFR